MTSETLKGNLRLLIASSSSEEVYNALTQIFKEDYAFLHGLYGKKITPIIDTPSFIPSGFSQPITFVSTPSSSVGAPPSIVVGAAPAQEAPKLRGDAKVRIVKKPADVHVSEVPVSQVPVSQAPVSQAPVSQAPVSQSPAPVVHTESGLRDPKDIKKWQKEQEDKKATELRAAGINPASLLTEANMRKWVVDEKKTFAAIAREYVGLSDGVIASEAKKYGLQSDVAKRRAAIMGAKKSKN